MFQSVQWIIIGVCALWGVLCLLLAIKQKIRPGGAALLVLAALLFAFESGSAATSATFRHYETLFRAQSVSVTLDGAQAQAPMANLFEDGNPHFSAFFEDLRLEDCADYAPVACGDVRFYTDNKEVGSMRIFRLQAPPEARRHAMYSIGGHVYVFACDAFLGKDGLYGFQHTFAEALLSLP